MTRPGEGRARAAGATEAIPKSVAILGLGPSLEAYAEVTKQLGGRRVLFEEVWGINSAIDVFNCDRGFHMDDVRVQEIRAAAQPDSNIANMLPWLRRHPGPIYTSVPHPEYPGLVAYPLEAVMNSCGGLAYFNGTAAYAVALAVHLRVEKICLFGIDFTLPNYHKAEQGRACVEFYLGIHRARGGVIGLPPGTSLLDGTATNDGRLYGYDGMSVGFADGGDNAPLRLTFTPRALPSAEEIERRYDATRHPNPLLRE